MRTSLFVSALFTVSLMGGAALAERPRVEIRLRAHGDVVDKAYSSAQAGRAGVGMGAAVQTTAPVRQARAGLDHGASRVYCSESGADCAAGRSPTHQTAAGDAGAMQVGQYNQRPPFLDRILGADRTNFNEAGEDQGMSLRAAKRAWSHGAASRAGSAGSVPGGVDRQGQREAGDKGSEARMSCNEADECSMSNKDVKKIWASASARAGTLNGAADKRPSNAERRIAEQRRNEGAAAHAPAAAAEVHGADASAQHADRAH